MEHFKKVSDYSDYLNIPTPEHPQMYLVNLRKSYKSHADIRQSSEPITTDFFQISLKKLVKGSFTYGRTEYDCQEGLMIFASPNQVFAWNNMELDEDGFGMTIHKDFFRGHPLNEKIKKFNFFNYSVHEALHLSPKEEATLWSVFKNIENEYHNNVDDFSKKIILSNIETMLSYCERYYNRQFIHRKELNLSAITQFDQILRKQVSSGQLEENGIPSLDFMADQMQMSKRYMNDVLKKETGKTTLENIHIFLITEAKERLLNPSTSISEVAYNLGFEYPQYFSRMFKKVEGISPREYVNLN